MNDLHYYSTVAKYSHTPNLALDKGTPIIGKLHPRWGIWGQWLIFKFKDV